jgi:hypothetical protein
MPENYVLLERTELNASAASVTFANIPQTGYTDLKIVVSGRTNRSLEVDGLNISFNTGGTYSGRRVFGAGSGTPGSDTTYAGMPFMAAATATTNVYGNAEIYITNYRNSNSKIFSIDGAGENNATTTYMGLGAGLWSGTAAITSITIAPETGTAILSGSTFSLYGIAEVGTTPAIAPKASGGNVIATDGTYWYHAFLASGTFTPALALSCDVLIVGGGGGGAGQGAGAGAGGYRSLTQSLSAIEYPVTVGAGGAGGAADTSGSGKPGTKGSDSTFNSNTSTGGGLGSNNFSTASLGSGGSGGGAGLLDSTNSIGAGNTPSTSPSQGNNAGTTSSANRAAGGGGGAGAVGGNGNSSSAGAGGAGSNAHSSWASATGTGVSGYFAGGGGGGSDDNGYTAAGGAGGAGGGGAGRRGNSTAGGAGTISTGSGGGGSGNTSGNANVAAGGAGGSGIIIIRYPITA